MKINVGKCLNGYDGVDLLIGEELKMKKKI